MRVVLGVEYCGIEYCGWQSQASGCGVQDALERALSQFLGVQANVICAGRTDTGVHAWEQVVHLDTELEREESSWVRGTNSHLPRTVRVLWARVLSGSLADEFHARFSARRRAYRYLLQNHFVAPAIMAGRMGWFHAALRLERMQEAAALLVGEHDFSAFRAAECQAKSPIKTMFRIDITRHAEVITFEFEANAYLHHMVRNMVGALVYVGCERLSLEQFAAIFEERDRTAAPPTFAPDGLYLCRIDYDSRFELPRATIPTTT